MFPLYCGKNPRVDLIVYVLIKHWTEGKLEIFENWFARPL